jgi:hypothetical protein
VKLQQPHYSVRPSAGNASRVLPSRKINALARASGFLQRKDRALSPVSLIKTLLVCVAQGSYTFRELATNNGLLKNKTISRSGLWQRIGPKAVAFVKSVAECAIAKSTKSVVELNLKKLPGIKRIIVEDSTLLLFHLRHLGRYPGGSSQDGPGKAQARLQLAFDLIGGKWIRASLDPYKHTDRAALWDIFGLLKKGDLLIRDLGYVSTVAFARIEALGAYFISRLDTTAALYDQEDCRLELIELARQNAPRPGDRVSVRVKLTATQKFPCRMVIVHAGEQVGAQRRRRLRAKAKDNGRTASSRLLALQDWTFLVTNLEDVEAISEKQIDHLYRIRWRIENLFKLVKSHSALKRIAAHDSNIDHIEVLIWGWILLMASLSANHWLATIEPKSGGHCPLSLTDGEIRAASLSAFKFFPNLLRFTALGVLLSETQNAGELFRRWIQQSHYHDRPDKRSDRMPLSEHLLLCLENRLQEPA